MSAAILGDRDAQNPQESLRSSWGLGRFGYGFDVPKQHVHLHEEVVLVRSHRSLEEARKVLKHPGLAAALCEQGQADDVEQKRGGEERVAALPDELQDHLRVQKTLEVDVVPRGLPVVERFDVLDRHERLRFVAADG
jgi:hypothetical protein